jgi:signal transduction histidine kinase
MSGEFLLSWAIMAVSLFNTVLLLWLGLTVLLNAEQRTWGIWLTGGGLLMGAAFFVSHSAILGYGLYHVGPGTEFWWRVGWVPVVTLPFAWYVVMLWYSGYWDNRQGDLRRRQRPWLILVSVLFGAFVGLLVIANPLPSYWQVARLELAATLAIGGIPAVILLYPLYIVQCIGLSLNALLRPEPSPRVMGDLARSRARPWLVGTSGVLLAVSILVAWVMLWIVSNARQRALYEVYTSMSDPVAWFDLVIASLIALSIVLLGQAIAAYEVFTGKTLPRRGLMRQWRRAVILAVGYGVAVGWSLALQLRPIYSLLLTTILMTLFFALLSWRSFAERERAMDQLRPFVASPRLYEHLLAPSPSSALDLDVRALFRALCDDVLGASVAYLVPLGPLTSLVGSALTYPEDGRALPAALIGIAAEFGSTRAMCVPLDPARYGRATWAVPLRSVQGLIGVLLLGEKQNGGLYSQEEIEIAQASGERLMDTLASIEVAQRLLALQRQRLAESRDYGELSRAVFDQRARRLLHDEVLPLLHTAVLTLSGSQSRASNTTDDPLHLLADAHRQISNLLCEMPVVAVPEIDRLGLVGALQKTVAEEMNGVFDEVTWQVDDKAERKARALTPLAAEVLFYAAREAIRNAAHHGRDRAGDRPLCLRVGLALAWREPVEGSEQGRLEILVEDDGVGFPASAPSVDGAGQGLALHSTMMAVVGGTLAFESLPGVHTRVLLTLPTT